MVACGRFCSWLCSSVGQKQLVGVAGLGLVGFLLVHMLGNVLIFFGPKAYNLYSHALISNPLIYGAEAGLLGIFVLHICIATALHFKNKKAKGRAYAQKASGAKSTHLWQRSLWWQGVVVLVFVVYHLVTFKFGPYYEAVYDTQTVRDLHLLVVEVFSQPLYVVGYLVALGILGVHLGHGVRSSFESLGVSGVMANGVTANGSSTCARLSWGVAALIVGGFMLQPVYVFFFLKGGY